MLNSYKRKRFDAGCRELTAGRWPSFHEFDRLLLYHRSLSVSLPKPRPPARVLIWFFCALHWAQFSLDSIPFFYEFFSALSAVCVPCSANHIINYELHHLWSTWIYMSSGRVRFFGSFMSLGPCFYTWKIYIKHFVYFVGVLWIAI